MDRIIVDTREQIEYDASHVEGAINITPAEFMDGPIPDQLKDVEKDVEVLLYCRSGARSNACGYILRDHGFMNIVNGTNEHITRKLLKETAE